MKADRFRFRQEREIRRRQILAELGKAGVPMSEVRENGYWFIFPYRGMRIIFMNQPNRLYGKMYRLPHSDEEEYMLESEAPLILFRRDGEARRFRRKFGYAEFQFYDVSAGAAVCKVLACARKKSLSLCAE